MKKLLILSIGIVLFGCKPKFDPNTEWKAIDVVFGVLDPDAPEQYILLNKLFQNTGGKDANDLAKINDSIYHSDSVSVRIIDLDNGGEPIYLEKTTKKRESGIFANPNHIVYMADSSKLKIDGNTNYRVEVINTKTQKISYAKLRTMDVISFTRPKGNGQVTLNFINNSKEEFKNVEIEIDNATDKLAVYNSTVYIIYETLLVQNDNVVSIDTLVFNANSGIEHDGTGGNRVTDRRESFEINGKSFLNFIGQNIDPVNPKEKYRRLSFNNLSYIEVVGFGQEMLEYTTAEGNFSSLSQTKPFYTNVFNAANDEEQVGLVSSKRKIKKLFILGVSSFGYLHDEFPNSGF